MGNENSLYEELAKMYHANFLVGSNWDRLTSFKDSHFDMKDISESEIEDRADSYNLEGEKRGNISYYIRSASYKGFGSFESEIRHIVKELKFWFKLK